MAFLEQIYSEEYKSTSLLSMNDIDMDSGYVLYETEVIIDTSGKATLSIENVRDYATLFLDGIFKGCLSMEHNTLVMDVTKGTYILQLYVENVGRITYGPEILDNSKGLFGIISLNNKILQNWKIIPLNILQCDLKKLNFSSDTLKVQPGFFRASFTLSNTESKHLDMTGWGMGEVWINNQYLGRYWEEESQKSIPVTSSFFIKGENQVVIFEMKKISATVNFTDKAVF